MIEYIVGPIMSCAAQACCWYSIFRWCGCIEREREVIYTEKPVVVSTNSNNPFINPGASKDAHLRPAYG